MALYLSFRVRITWNLLGLWCPVRFPIMSYYYPIENLLDDIVTAVSAFLGISLIFTSSDTRSPVFGQVYIISPERNLPAPLPTLARYTVSPVEPFSSVKLFTFFSTVRFNGIIIPFVGIQSRFHTLDILHSPFG